MFAEKPLSIFFAVKLYIALEMIPHHFADFFGWNLFAIEAGEDPWIGNRGATDHNRVTICVTLHPFNIADRFHIPASDDRNLHRGLDLGNRVPVRVAAVSLLFRPSVDGDQRASVLLHDA